MSRGPKQVSGRTGLESRSPDLVSRTVTALTASTAECHLDTGCSMGTALKLEIIVPALQS